jgi:hypothetical protein
MATPGPVTLSNLCHRGLTLLVRCRCGHRAELDPTTIRLRPSTPIPKIETKFRCAACCAKNTAIDFPIKALMDPRPRQCIKP